MSQGDGTCFENASFNVPNTRVYVTGPHPKEYDVLIPVAGAFTIMTTVLTIIHLVRLYLHTPKQTGCLVLVLTCYQASLPSIVSIIAFISAVEARSENVCMILIAGFEAIGVLGFRGLLLAYAGVSSQTPLTDRLANRPPGPIYWYHRCSGESRQPTTFDFYLSSGFVYQMVLIVPGVSLLELAPVVAQNSKVERLLAAIDLLSVVVAIQGLIVTINIFHDILKEQRPRWKLLILKVSFFAGIFPKRIANFVISQDQVVDGLCFPAAALATTWAGAITDIICFCLSIAIFGVWRASDLRHVSAHEKHHEECPIPVVNPTVVSVSDPPPTKIPL